ncbi:hypothetical protein YC2023_097283 [Brassica napus]
MDARFLYPLESCKIIHLVSDKSLTRLINYTQVTSSVTFLILANNVYYIFKLRHGQAMHNVAAEKDRNALLSPHLFDAPLTDHGHEQVNTKHVETLRERVVSSGLLKRVELVVTSPLLRTMQTAVGVFGNEDKQQNVTSSPSIVALEVARDRNVRLIHGVRPPDMRRNVSELKVKRTIYGGPMSENPKKRFLREEKEVAVVSHGIVLQHMLYVFANDCDDSIRHELCKSIGFYVLYMLGENNRLMFVH